MGRGAARRRRAVGGGRGRHRGGADGHSRARARATRRSSTGPDEDVHSFVERQLVERIGDAGRRLHTGRSRNEQVSLDLRLYLRRRTAVLQQGLAAVIGALADLAERCGDVADAGVHAPAAGAARARRALPARARGRAAPRPRAPRRGRRRSRRAAARLGRGRRHQLRDRHGRARGAPRLLARRRQQHRRVVGSRLRRRRSCTRARWRWCT